jgi:AbrB family looped-hinge helix DNA binding protein
MKSTIDESGRLVIPREVRRAAGLEPGMPLDVRVDDGAVVIEPAPMPVSMERRGRFVVAQPSRPVPALKERTVQKTRERLLGERGAGRGRKKG